MRAFTASEQGGEKTGSSEFRCLGKRGESKTPRTLLSGLDPENSRERKGHERLATRQNGTLKEEKNHEKTRPKPKSLAFSTTLPRTLGKSGGRDNELILLHT